MKFQFPDTLKRCHFKPMKYLFLLGHVGVKNIFFRIIFWKRFYPSARTKTESSWVSLKKHNLTWSFRIIRKKRKTMVGKFDRS